MRLRPRSGGQEADPVAYIGDLPIDATGLEETAQAFIGYCQSQERRDAERPIFSTSVNGQVVSNCALDREIAQLFRSADSINADGQPIVTLSRPPVAHAAAGASRHDRPLSDGRASRRRGRRRRSTCWAGRKTVNRAAVENALAASSRLAHHRPAQRLLFEERRVGDRRRYRPSRAGHSLGRARRAVRAAILRAQPRGYARRRHRKDFRRTV